MSVAHLYSDEFTDNIMERIEHPYKAPPPEFEIDTGKINQELDVHRVRHLSKSVFLFLVTTPIFLQDTEDNWKILLLAIFLAVITEVLYLRS